MTQALGYAHCEEFAYDDAGRMLNDRLGPYKIYRADEMPETEVFLVQTMEDPAVRGEGGRRDPQGRRRAGDCATRSSTPPGSRIDDMPFTPERVWAALRRVGMTTDRDDHPCAGRRARRGRRGGHGDVVRTAHSVPRHAGAKMLVYARRAHSSAPIGGGEMESRVRASALDALGDRPTRPR